MIEMEVNNAYTKTVMELLPILNFFNIKHEVERLYDGYKILFDDFPGGDAIVHMWSSGYVETYGMPWDDGDVTTMTPQELVMRLCNQLEGE